MQTNKGHRIYLDSVAFAQTGSHLPFTWELSSLGNYSLAFRTIIRCDHSHNGVLHLRAGVSES